MTQVAEKHDLYILFSYYIFTICLRSGIPETAFFYGRVSVWKTFPALFRKVDES